MPKKGRGNRGNTFSLQEFLRRSPSPSPSRDDRPQLYLRNNPEFNAYDTDPHAAAAFDIKSPPGWSLNSMPFRSFMPEYRFHPNRSPSPNRLIPDPLGAAHYRTANSRGPINFPLTFPFPDAKRIWYNRVWDDNRPANLPPSVWDDPPPVRTIASRGMPTFMPPMLPLAPYMHATVNPYLYTGGNQGFYEISTPHGPLLTTSSFASDVNMNAFPYAQGSQGFYGHATGSHTPLFPTSSHVPSYNEPMETDAPEPSNYHDKDLGGNDLVKRAIEDYKAHLNNWTILKDKAKGDQWLMVRLLLIWPELRCALCFDPGLMDKRVENVGNTNWDAWCYRERAQKLITEILSENPMVHLVINQSVRDLPIIIDTPAMWDWVAWRDVRDCYKPVSLNDAIKGQYVNILSEDYCRWLLKHGWSPVVGNMERNEYFTWQYKLKKAGHWKKDLVPDESIKDLKTCLDLDNLISVAVPELTPHGYESLLNQSDDSECEMI